MAEPKHKPKEHKKKGFWHKLKSSAIFILAMIGLATLDIVFFLNWLSGLLSAGWDPKKLGSLYISAGITGFFVVLFGAIWVSKKLGERAKA